jgi:hypothetical protein
MFKWVLLVNRPSLPCVQLAKSGNLAIDTLVLSHSFYVGYHSIVDCAPNMELSLALDTTHFEPADGHLFRANRAIVTLVAFTTHSLDHLQF